mgnify:CR=1 FL=1
MEDKLKKALMKKAFGYTFNEVTEEYSTNENGDSVLTKKKVTKKFNPPDVTALKILLEQSQLFDDEISKMTDEQLIAERDRLLKLLKSEEDKK